MQTSARFTALIVMVLVGALTSRARATTYPTDWSVKQTPDGGAEVRIGAVTIATYIPHDDKTQRPYFKDLKTPSGVQVTRAHPPVKGQDAEDHPDMHPGLWLAFSDLGGHDFWRNKGPRVDQEKLTLTGPAGFEVVNRYLDGEHVLARETNRFSFRRDDLQGYLIIWDTTLEPQVDGLYLGGAEEMGLGVRVATPITVKKGKGHIRNDLKGVDEKGTWGNAADWCDYSGPIDEQQVGVTLMAHPGNPNKTWFHSRDYGLLVANPSGERAGAPAKWMLERGKPVHLRYGVFVHESPLDKGPNLANEFKSFANVTQYAGEPGKTQPAPPEPDGMVSLFDGKTLTNWDGDPRLWSVKDGTLRGETTKENPANGNTFIFWTGGTVKDFELRLSFRCSRTPGNNSGVQYRSAHVTGGDVKNKWTAKGYQAEVRLDDVTPGFIYDERGKRGRLCLVGEQAVWENGKKNVTGTVGDPATIAAALKPDGWNDYVIIAKGNHIQHFLNGVQTVDFTDKDPKLALSEGVLALQLHTGKPMWVEFKDLRLKQF